MVEKNRLKEIGLLQDVPDSFLEKIGQIAQLETFDEETILFRQNQDQFLVYMLVSGLIFLNSRSSSGKLLTLDAVSPGRTFGLSALMGEASPTFTAICAEKSTLITISGQQMRELFESHFDIGFTLMKKVAELFRGRTEMHTRQFLQTLSTHTEIEKLYS